MGSHDRHDFPPGVLFGFELLKVSAAETHDYP
jgi:hypothetical protein